jgi:hypothetical protein
MQNDIYQQYMMDHHPYSQDIGKSLICGLINIRIGGPFACFIWIVNSIHDYTYMLFLTCFFYHQLINMYGCVLSFQGKSRKYKLMIYHSLSCIKLFILYSNLFLFKPSNDTRSRICLSMVCYLCIDFTLFIYNSKFFIDRYKHPLWHNQIYLCL